MKHLTDSLLVAIDFTNGTDNTVLCVGRKRPNQSIEIINAFAGDEARELWEKLITKKEKE